MNNQSQIEIKDFHKPSPVITGFLLPVYNGTIILLIWICFKVQKAVLKTIDRLGSRHINTIIKTNVVNIQPRNFAYMWLLNKPYENEVTLTEQNPRSKCCQHLET